MPRKAEAAAGMGLYHGSGVCEGSRDRRGSKSDGREMYRVAVHRLGGSLCKAKSLEGETRAISRI
jgi:hypothetical protein